MGEQRFGFALQGLRFNTYAAYLTASPQNCIGNRQFKIMQRAIFKTVRCMRSAFRWTPGCRLQRVDVQYPCVHKRGRYSHTRLHHPYAKHALGNQIVAQSGSQSVQTSWLLHILCLR
jgi:hypothetical protein